MQAVADLVESLFGSGTELSPLQMVCRAINVFIAALVLMRASGRRSFGQHTAFDICVTVLLGAVLSRAVVGASPYWPTLAAGTAIALLHRLLALVCVRAPALEAWLAGKPVEIVRDGVADERAMHAALVSLEDLRKEMRKHAGHDDLARLKRAMLERDGSVSIAAEK